MPERGIYRAASVKGYAMPTNAPVYVNSSDNLIHIIPAGTGSTEVIVPTQTSTSGARMAAGSGSRVSGAATVATGLTSVLSFTAGLSGTGARATGATEVAQLSVSSITTGSVSLIGMYSTAAATWVTSVSGTSGFYWTAVGM